MVWDDSIKDWRKQPRFVNTPDCYARPVFEDLNDWNFITIAAKIPVKNKGGKAAKTQVYEDEMQACYDHVLHDYESRAILGCKPNTDSTKRQFGAIDAEVNDDCQDGYYLVEWTGDAFMLQEPWDVEGCVDQMPAGTWVIEGRYLDRIAQNPHWYHYRYNNDKLLFRLQYVAVPSISPELYNPDINLKPASFGHLEPWQVMSADRNLYKVPRDAWELIRQEAAAREKNEFVEYTVEDELDGLDGSATQNDTGVEGEEEDPGDYNQIQTI